MKPKYVSPLRFSILLSLLMVTLFSCDKDDSDPDYVGTWVSLQTVIVDEQTLETKEIQSFSGNAFTNILQIKNPDTNVWLDYSSFKGTITVNGKIMSATITEAGISALNPLTGYPTGTIIYVKSNETGFNDILTIFGIPATFNSEYSVADRELTLKTDYNSDADFSDAGELVTYTRQ